MIRPFNRGSIWWTNLNPGSSTEPGKRRPVLLFQDQALLDAQHPSTLIIPLTSRLSEDAEPLRIRISAQGALEKDSDLLIDQIRAIDNKRLVKGPILQLDDGLLEKIGQAVNEVLGL